MMSMLVKPQPLPLARQFHLNACVAVSAHEFFSRYAGDDTTIKWPNDLYWQDRKAGGVLIESIVRSPSVAIGSPTAMQESGVGAWDWAIIGIGININQTVFPSHLPNPVSLKQITGKSFDVIDLTRRLCEILNKNFMLLQDGGFEKIYDDYLEHLYKKDKKVMLKKGIRVFEAVIRSVSPSGKLVVQHGIEEEFDSGEIEWVM